MIDRSLLRPHLFAQDGMCYNVRHTYPARYSVDLLPVG